MTATHRLPTRRTTWVLRALAGVAFSVALYYLQWISSTMIAQLQTTATLQVQITYLTQAITDLKSQGVEVSSLKGRMQKVETRQEDIEHRVSRLEGYRR